MNSAQIYEVADPFEEGPSIGFPTGAAKKGHQEADGVDRPGTPTKRAKERVIEFFRQRVFCFS